jgi:hypothetical protein
VAIDNFLFIATKDVVAIDSFDRRTTTYVVAIDLTFWVQYVAPSLKVSHQGYFPLFLFFPLKKQNAT